MADSTGKIERIDPIAERFEKAWKSSSTPPEIRPFLQDVDKEILIDLLKELIAIDVEYRLGHGEVRLQKKYEQDFPEIAGAAELRRLFYAEALDDLLQGSRSAIPSDAAPTHIGKYLVIAALDRGGQAEVFLGLHPMLKSQVALKRFRIDNGAGIPRFGVPASRSAEHETFLDSTGHATGEVMYF